LSPLPGPMPAMEGRKRETNVTYSSTSRGRGKKKTPRFACTTEGKNKKGKATARPSPPPGTDKEEKKSPDWVTAPCTAGIRGGRHPM